MIDDYVDTEVTVDDAVIDSGDVWKVVDPVWWSVWIYGTPERYHSDLAKVSIPQRHVLAILWHAAEVNNGGHHQFYFNPTGIVWREALEGFLAIGAPDLAEVIQQSANVLGGAPALDFDERDKQISPIELGTFDDIDDRYYERAENLEARLMDYVRKHRSAFYFSGVVKKPPPAPTLSAD